jgi:hypothetical protein
MAFSGISLPSLVSEDWSHLRTSPKNTGMEKAVPMLARLFLCDSREMGPMVSTRLGLRNTRQLNGTRGTRAMYRTPGKGFG